MILALKIFSIFITALLGILSLLFNFRNDEGRITNQGKLILTIILLSSFASIITTIIESNQNKIEAQEQLAKTTKVLHEFSRTQTPITRAKITYWLELPQSNIEVSNYSRYVDELIASNADQFLDPITSVDQLFDKSSNPNLEVNSLDQNGSPINVEIKINSKYWPSPEEYEALSSVALFYSFSMYINKYSVDPKMFNSMVSTNPGYSDFIASDIYIAQNYLDYDYLNKKLFIRGSYEFVPAFWKKNGNISSIVDLNGAQILLLSNFSGNYEGVHRITKIFSDKLLKKQGELGKAVNIKTILLSFADGHEIWIDGTHIKKSSYRGGYPVFSIILPKDNEGLLNLQEKTKH